MSDRRPTPGEDEVRDQLRREEELIDASPTSEQQAEARGEDQPGSSPDPSAESPEPGAPADEPSQSTEPESSEDALRGERDEYLALAQRAQADFENYRKRAAREAAAAGTRAKSGLVNELLPVLDNLERALQSAGEQEEHLAGGVRLVHSELVSMLSRNGIQQFDPHGEAFDPDQHEALSMREQEGAEPGVVLDVVEKGYRLGDSVVRPARVIVSS